MDIQNRPNPVQSRNCIKKSRNCNLKSRNCNFAKSISVDYQLVTISENAGFCLFSADFRKKSTCIYIIYIINIILNYNYIKYINILLYNKRGGILQNLAIATKNLAIATFNLAIALKNLAIATFFDAIATFNVKTTLKTIPS